MDDNNEGFHDSLLLDEQDQAIIFEAYFDDMKDPEETSPEVNSLLNSMSALQFEVSLLCPNKNLEKT